MHRVVGASARRRSRRSRALVAAEAVDQDRRLGAVPGGEGGDLRPAGLDVVDAQQRRAAVGEPEEALEADREVEVAAGPEAARAEGVEAREAALAQRQPGAASVPITTSGVAARARYDLAAVAVAARPPSPSPRSSSSILVGRAEASRRRPGSARAGTRTPPRTRRSRCSSGAPAVQRPPKPMRVPNGRSRGVAANRAIGCPRARGADPRHPERRAARRSSRASRRGRHLRLRADRLRPHPHRQRAARTSSSRC